MRSDIASCRQKLADAALGIASARKDLSEGKYDSALGTLELTLKYLEVELPPGETDARLDRVDRAVAGQLKERSVSH